MSLKQCKSKYVLKKSLQKTFICSSGQIRANLLLEDVPLRGSCGTTATLGFMCFRASWNRCPASVLSRWTNVWRLKIHISNDWLKRWVAVMAIWVADTVSPDDRRTCSCFLRRQKVAYIIPAAPFNQVLHNMCKAGSFAMRFQC